MFISVNIGSSTVYKVYISGNNIPSTFRETSVLSDEEAQEVFILLSPTEKTAPQHTPNTSQDPAPPPVPPHYTKPGQGDEYDNALTPQYDPSLTSPLSPEDEPSDHDSSDASGAAGEGFQVTRVKEVSVAVLWCGGVVEKDRINLLVSDSPHYYYLPSPSLISPHHHTLPSPSPISPHHHPSPLR